MTMNNQPTVKRNLTITRQGSDKINKLCNWLGVGRSKLAYICLEYYFLSDYEKQEQATKYNYFGISYTPAEAINQQIETAPPRTFTRANKYVTKKQLEKKELEKQVKVKYSVEQIIYKLQNLIVDHDLTKTSSILMPYVSVVLLQEYYLDKLTEYKYNKVVENIIQQKYPKENLGISFYLELKKSLQPKELQSLSR